MTKIQNNSPITECNRKALQFLFLLKFPNNNCGDDLSITGFFVLKSFDNLA